MKQCINCGKELADDAAFCNTCGTKQVQEPKTCSNCGAPIDEESAFCSKCGAKQDSNMQSMHKSIASNPVIIENHTDISTKMSIIDAVKNVFSNYANFNGRARRSEYWYFTLFNLIAAIVIGIICAIANSKIPLRLWQLAIALPCLSLGVRRLHDIGKSGKYAFIALIPIIGWIILIVWAAQDSQPGTNQYGHNPKGE